MKLFASNKQRPQSKGLAEARKDKAPISHSIWRRIRHLEARIAAIEAQASTLRRDVNRVDRQGYREATASNSKEMAKIFQQVLEEYGGNNR